MRKEAKSTRHMENEATGTRKQRHGQKCVGEITWEICGQSTRI